MQKFATISRFARSDDLIGLYCPGPKWRQFLEGGGIRAGVKKASVKRAKNLGK